jgi:hypothetical protein
VQSRRLGLPACQGALNHRASLAQASHRPAGKSICVVDGRRAMSSHRSRHVWLPFAVKDAPSVAGDSVSSGCPVGDRVAEVDQCAAQSPRSHLVSGSLSCMGSGTRTVSPTAEPGGPVHVTCRRPHQVPLPFRLIRSYALS